MAENTAKAKIGRNFRQSFHTPTSRQCGVSLAEFTPTVRRAALTTGSVYGLHLPLSADARSTERSGVRARVFISCVCDSVVFIKVIPSHFTLRRAPCSFFPALARMICTSRSARTQQLVLPSLRLYPRQLIIPGHDPAPPRCAAAAALLTYSVGARVACLPTGNWNYCVTPSHVTKSHFRSTRRCRKSDRRNSKLSTAADRGRCVTSK